jgi:hypothetical protein
MKDKIGGLVDKIMIKMMKSNAYFEQGHEATKNALSQYLEREYDKEMAALNMKIDLEKQRGLYKADSMERLEVEAKYVSMRMANKIDALAYTGKTTEEHKS